MTTSADLKSDIKANLIELRAMADDPTACDGPAIVNHLLNTMWPFLDGTLDHLAKMEAAIDDQADVVEELGDAVDELTESQGDLLTPETAGVFAMIVLFGRGLFENYIDKGLAVPAEIKAQFLAACSTAEAKIEEITINVDDTASSDEEDEEDDDDD